MGQQNIIYRRQGAYQVVPEELHDEGRVLVALLRQSVELCNYVSPSTLNL